MEKEIVKDEHHKYSTANLLRTVNSVMNVLIASGIIFLVNQSVQNREDIALIRETIEYDKRDITRLTEDYKKLGNMELNVQLIKHDVEQMDIKIKKIEDRLTTQYSH